VQQLAHLAVSEVAAIYREAFAVLCPSFEEGFGLTVLEGLTLGRPVWASRTRTHQEVGAEAVNYFDPLGSDIETLARDIKALSQNESEYRERIARGRRRAADFEWGRTARRFLELVG
jgi:glycosyltransferase involved in cell wall biosynthesis